MSRSRCLAPLLLTLITGVLACPTEEVPDDPGDPPAAPAENDAAYDVTPIRTWNLVANAATDGHDVLDLEVVAPPDVGEIRPWLAGEPGDLLVADGDAFRGEVDIASLAAGSHELLLQADGDDIAFAVLPFVRSHPLYILTTVDWDDPDIADHELEWHEQLHEDHPHLRLTEFVGPYTFTESSVSAERAAELVEWLLGMRDDHGTEIGLHIHPYCSFVEAAGVTCLHEPSFVYDEGDDTGLTIFNSAYSEAEYTALLEKADEIFVENGLGKPITYRAGGWTADAEVLMALEANGYVADTSAANWACLEEWDGAANGELWAFLTDQWSEIDATSQPYYPSEADAGVPGEPSIGVLEVPDNACLADYVSAEEMIAVLDANWAGEPLLEPRVWSIGFHHVTSSIYVAFRDNVDGALEYADQYLAAEDGGPLVYGTLKEMPLVWPYED